MFLIDKYNPISAHSVPFRLKAGETIYVWIVKDKGIFKHGIYCLSTSPGAWVQGCLKILTDEDAVYMVRKKVIT